MPSDLDGVEPRTPGARRVKLDSRDSLVRVFKTQIQRIPYNGCDQPAIPARDRLTKRTFNLRLRDYSSELKKGTVGAHARQTHGNGFWVPQQAIGSRDALLEMGHSDDRLGRSRRLRPVDHVRL